MFSVTALRRLFEKGQRSFNLAALQAPDLNANSNFTSFFSAVNAAVALTDAAGIPRNCTSVYVLDESSAKEDVAVLPIVSREVKLRFGREVQVVTCGQNQWWLRTTGEPRQSFPDVDIFIPPLAGHFLPGTGAVAGAVASFANTTNTAAANEVRKANQVVGLYTSGFPYGADALNWALELPVIRSRILMGVAMHSGHAGAFLYYRLNKWSQYAASAGTGGPLGTGDVTTTMEVTGYRSAPYGYDGMGQLILPGMNGALSTIHFENIRDGLEDHSLLDQLSQLVRRGLVLGANVSAAKELLQVPPYIFRSFDPNPKPTQRSFSQNPALLRAYRHSVARAIVALQHELRP